MPLQDRQDSSHSQQKQYVIAAVKKKNKRTSTIVSKIVAKILLLSALLNLYSSASMSARASRVNVVLLALPVLKNALLVEDEAFG